MRRGYGQQKSPDNELTTQVFRLSETFFRKKFSLFIIHPERLFLCQISSETPIVLRTYSGAQLVLLTEEGVPLLGTDAATLASEILFVSGKEYGVHTFVPLGGSLDEETGETGGEFINAEDASSYKKRGAGGTQKSLPVFYPPHRWVYQLVPRIDFDHTLELVRSYVAKYQPAEFDPSLSIEVDGRKIDSSNLLREKEFAEPKYPIMGKFAAFRPGYFGDTQSSECAW